MIHRSLLIAGFLLLSSHLYGQHWMELWRETDTNFYAIQEAFYQNQSDSDSEEREIEKEGYWKLFKRWEAFMLPRVHPDGKRPPLHQAWSSYRKFQQHASEHQRQAVFQGNWSSLGLEAWERRNTASPGNGRINAIAMHPKDTSILYIGSPSGGLWKTTDSGRTWTPLTDTLPILGVSEIVIHPTNPDTVYIATGDGDGWSTYSIGVLKSTDGGQTWQPTGLSWSTNYYYQLFDLVMHPEDPSILLAAGRNGIKKTTDGGQNWTQVHGSRVEDIKFHPQHPRIIYAAGEEFFKSVDTANSFTKITQGVPPANDVVRMELGTTPAAPHYVYLLAANNQGGFYGLYRSVDTGNTFIMRSDTPNILGWSPNPSGNSGQGGYDLAMAVSKTDPDKIYTGGINIWQSADGGQSWDIITHWVYEKVYPYVHADIHDLKFLNDRLFAACDGGIYKRRFNDPDWIDLSEDLGITQFYRMGDFPGRTDWICGGCQDNGSFLYNGNQRWFSISGGDGMECNIDYTDSTIIYTSYQLGGLLKSTDAGRTFSGITSDDMGDGAWVTPYTIHPHHPRTLLAGFQEVWKSTNRGGSWSALSSFNSPNRLHTLKLAPSNPEYIYTATFDTIYQSEDGGENWTVISDNLPVSAAISSVAVHSTDPEKIWVSFSGYGASDKVYKSTNGGQNWSNVTGNLPNLPVNTIVYEHGSDQGVYVGTDIGIYYRDTTLGNWVSFMDSLPNVIVNELDIHYPSNQIRAATYGRGIWESPLYGCTENPQPPRAGFKATDTEICVKEQTQLIDQSLHCPAAEEWELPGGTVTNASSRYPSVYYSSAGQFDVTRKTRNQYGGDTLNRSDYITVHPKPPTPSVYQEGDTLLTDANAESYQWKYYGSPISGAVRPYYITSKEGYYSVVVTDSNGCKRTSSSFPVSVADQPSVKGEWTVGPNPVSEYLRIDGQNLSPDMRLSVKLEDLMGRTHHTFQERISVPTYVRTIDVSDLESGVYLLHLETPHTRWVKKLVIR